MARQSKDSHCSFCGTPKSETLMLIEGLDAYICDKCVTQANVLLAQELGNKKGKAFDESFKLLKPAEIKAHLDQYVIGQYDAKKVLSVAVYNHYKRLSQKIDKDEVEIEKSNIMLVGETGTGKTLAFLTATFHHLLTHEPKGSGQPRAIIMAPTRELAVQIHQDAKILADKAGLRLGLIYGGEGYDTQRQLLENGVDILIGTTGRLIDYLKQGLYDLSQIQVVVLDEADRMFDLGFIKDIRFMFNRMPPATERLSLLFSATLSYKVQELAFEKMNQIVFCFRRFVFHHSPIGFLGFTITEHFIHSR